MKIRYQLQKILLITCTVLFCYCNDGDKQIKDTLYVAGENAKEVEKLLDYYEKVSPDKKKLSAVRFLVENMRFHSSEVAVSRQPNLLLDSITQLAESILYDFVRDTPSDSLYSVASKNKMRKIERAFKNQYAASVRDCEVKIKWKTLSDARHLRADDLIKHIDHAFYQKDTSPFLQDISFEDFCEYVLPYRVNPHFPIIDSLSVYRAFNEKFFTGMQVDSIKDMVVRCNFIMDHIMHFMPAYIAENKNIGYQGLFFSQLYNCIPIAHYGASFLRSAGVPVAVEFNIAHREFNSMHQHCVVPDQTNEGRWLQFTPGTSVPDPNAEPVFERVMNIYRFCYSMQKDSPFFLKKQGEYVYPPLNTPFIKDVSANHVAVSSVRLPFKEKTKNKLAYLGTFSQSAPTGIIPVTWGKINKLFRSVTFENVVANRLYFPIYYTEAGELKAFGNCFFVDSSGNRVDLVNDKNEEAEHISKVILTRKFPRKDHLFERSKGLAGAYILGANDSLMVCPDTLGRITEHPEPYLQDIKLDMKNGPYRYYRLVSTDKANAAISELYYLTDSAYGYDNVLPATALPILSPDDTLPAQSLLVRVLDRSPEASLKLRLGDNNWNTYISTDSLNYRLKKPQYVDRIRFMPLHADNGIHIGDVYQLLYWNVGQRAWEEVDTQIARYNYLELELPSNKLFWLRNLTKGKEELPFVLDENGKQVFVYYGLPAGKREVEIKN